MKCDDCLNLLEEYLDGEASARDAEQVNIHLSTCANCANELESLTAEQEIYARYDRELEISPSMWQAIAARTVEQHGAPDSRTRLGFGEWLAGLFALPRYGFALPAMAVVILALLLGVVFLRTKTTRQPSSPEALVGNPKPKPKPSSSSSQDGPKIKPTGPVKDQKDSRPVPKKTSPPRAPIRYRRTEPSDVIDVAYTDIEDKDTASHLDQAQNLLVSFRSIKFSDYDEQVDVSYEKSESRRLLNENIVLRRDAEMTGKFPAKSMLGSLEPFLIDIANLPDKATPSDLRQIKDRMQKSEIVAELRSY